MVAYFVLRRRKNGVAICNLRPYNRRFAFPNDNFSTVIPILMQILTFSTFEVFLFSTQSKQKVGFVSFGVVGWCNGAG